MTLKRAAAVAATVAVTQCLTVNILVGALTGGEVPTIVNLFTVAAASVSVVVAVQAEFHYRTQDRLRAMNDLLVARLSEIEERTTDHHAGFVEGLLLTHGHDSTVRPLTSPGNGRRPH
ncbi:hypothetical protein RB614_12835 [Phytohabitans sp. ZYX-F-186]|uniref:SMODS and SLOG-associating 2TM effector domain-containing protein n=1 Tax=Phytohabitans maris TaxID=3071409 RepID=A0ABU0ZED8_9ACTN|nr:hypothetical protein [Phytohabitans sp. ZYX-F-186]MDQ7905411.1 hypothetical protein [Phytohabitans sp. ZYX-F-186]